MDYLVFKKIEYIFFCEICIKMLLKNDLIRYIANHLKNNDINSHIKENHSITILHYATLAGFLDIVKYLLDNGAYHSSLDAYNCTPLHYAAARGYTDIVKLLLNVGADCEFMSNDGCDALEYSTMFSNSDISTLLIKSIINKIK